jgi:hypothetical protein
MATRLTPKTVAEVRAQRASKDDIANVRASAFAKATADQENMTRPP